MLYYVRYALRSISTFKSYKHFFTFMEHLLKVRKNSVIQEPVQRIIIGVAGGSAAGKTTLCENINRQMAFDRNFKVEMVSLDSFYKSLGEHVNASEYNFDHPNALDFDLAYETLRQMKESNERVPIPQYSFIEHKRLPDPTYANPANIILFEGLMAFHDPRIRDLMTYKVFITCDDDIRLCRRLKRDTVERGRSIESVLLQYNKFVKDSFRNFIQPTMVYADIIIPGFRNNRVSVDFIVQHIKNIARRINYRETASRTKIYIFGENELYDFEYRESHQTQIALFQESFLVFPTSEEHKKQLEFFMNRLISETFSYEYYEEIYICQFIKVQKSLLNQLVQLKGYKIRNIQVFSEHNISEIEKYELYSKPIKVIFFPVAYSNNAQNLLTLIKRQKKQDPNSVHIIMTIFCDMNFPRIIYKLGYPNVILINLFIIANDRRFREAMDNNIMSSERRENWLISDEILTNQGAYVISNDLKLNYLSDLDLEAKKYDIAVQNQSKKMVERKVDESKEIVKPFFQKNVYSQQHQNLCGYHTLVNIILRSKKEDVTSKEKFLKYYSILSKVAESKKFEVLQRSSIYSLLRHSYFSNLHVGVLYYSTGYIQNNLDELNELEKAFAAFISGNIDNFYLIMGVYDHFFLLQLTMTKKDGIQVNMFDSTNISLTDIMNENYEQYKKEHTEVDQLEFESYKRHIKNTKEALEIISVVIKREKSFKQILVEKRIEQIVAPFLELKDEKEIENYFKNEYPIPVIVNDLLKPLKKVQEKTLSEKHRKLLTEWKSHPAIKWGVLANATK